MRLWPSGGLWRHPDFLKLWTAQGVSEFGSQVSQIAIPLVAVIGLHASPFEVAALGAVLFLPFLLFSLPAGVWVDRLRRRPILVVADAGRALALASIPIAAAFHDLTMGQLYVVAFVAGTLTVFFDVSYQSYLPSLVERSDLVDANAKLEVTRSAAQIGGPGLGGLLVRAFGASYAVLADALSFVWSAAFLFTIRRHEELPPVQEGRRSIGRELVDGLRYLVHHRYWRPIAISTATFNFFNNVAFSILIVYAVRTLHMSPLEIGLTFSLSNGGALVAAILVKRIGTRLGVGHTIVLAATIDSLSLVLVPLAPASFPIPFLVLAFSLVGFGVVLYNVTAISLTQALTPERLLGRVNASRRFIVWGTIPLGSLIGGALATSIGMRPTMFVGTLASTLSIVPLLVSPVHAITTMPEQPEVSPFIDALLPEVPRVAPEPPAAA